MSYRKVPGVLSYGVGRSSSIRWRTSDWELSAANAVSGRRRSAMLDRHLELERSRDHVDDRHLDQDGIRLSGLGDAHVLDVLDQGMDQEAALQVCLAVLKQSLVTK